MQHLKLLLPVLLGVLTVSIQAQPYPNKPIKLIVGFAPGGAADYVARNISVPLGQALGQSIVIENKPGAGSSIAAEQVAKSAPDGYTIGMGQTAFAVNASLSKNLPYDTLKDFTPLVFIAEHAGVVLAQSQKPYNTFSEFIKYVKDNPGKVVYSSAGIGSWPHLSMVMLANDANLSMLHVPYQGTGPAKADLIAGRVDVKIEAYATSRGMIKEGQIKMLAVTSENRIPELPNVPTVAELGYPGYETSYWIAVMGPAGLPPEVTSKLEKAFMETMKDPTVIAKLSEQSIVPKGLPAKDLSAHIKKEISKWAKVIKDGGLDKQ